MKFANTKLKRVCLALSVVAAGVGVFIFLIISPLAKFLIEKYDETYTGRQITLDWVYVNPLTGFVHFRNFKVFEEKKDTLFFSARDIRLDVAMLKLLRKTWELTEVIIDKPRGTVIQSKGRALNFDDLITRFSSKSGSTKSSTHINILHVKIRHGEFYYHEKVIPIRYIIRDLNLESSGKRWDADTISSVFSFLSQNGKGGIKGDFVINVRKAHFRVAAQVRNFDLEIIRQYLWELINYGLFSAQLDASIKATGSFTNQDSIDLHGRFSVKNFHLGKSITDNYLTFDKMVVVINQLNPANKKFNFDSIAVIRPFLKYEKFDSLNNVEMLFGKKGANISAVTSQTGRFNLVIEIGRYLKKITRNFFQSHYSVHSLLITQGELKFNDYSLSEQFSIGVNSLRVRADSIDKNNRRVRVNVHSTIQPYGKLTVALSINPKDSGDFDMTYLVDKMPVAVFNPYVISYTSFPLDRGVLQFEGIWNVRQGEIKSVNHLVLIDPRISKRVRNNDLKWIPLPLIMAFIRERGNVIDYQIPISGNLKNPRFHLRDVVLDLVKNVFVKPVTIPFGLALRSAENEIENSVRITWSPRQQTLSPHQRKVVHEIAKFLKKSPESSVRVYLNEYASKEREQILFFEAKKKYFLLLHAKDMQHFSADDSMEVDRMSIKDPSFMHALKRSVKAGDTTLFTIQDKCNRFASNHKINARYAQLMKSRKDEFLELFIKNDTRRQVEIQGASDSIPFDGFSMFKVVYKGDIPKSLHRAYKDMIEINDEAIRRRYFKGKN